MALHARSAMYVCASRACAGTPPCRAWSRAAGSQKVISDPTSSTLVCLPTNLRVCLLALRPQVRVYLVRLCETEEEKRRYIAAVQAAFGGWCKDVSEGARAPGRVGQGPGRMLLRCGWLLRDAKGGKALIFSSGQRFVHDGD